MVEVVRVLEAQAFPVPLPLGVLLTHLLSGSLRGWGFSSVVERLPRKRKALGSVPSSEKKNQKKKKKKKKVDP